MEAADSGETDSGKQQPHNLHSTSQSLHAGGRKKLTDSRNPSRLHPDFFQAY